MRSSRFRDAAHILFQKHGAASATVAGDHAEEHFANIDVGGFAYWKNVETFIRDVLHRAVIQLEDPEHRTYGRALSGGAFS